MLENFHSPFDATVVTLLSDNGAEIVGKANCDEFGMGYDLIFLCGHINQLNSLFFSSLNVHSVHGPVVNPFNWNADNNFEHRSAGGSSGGSAAAVAANMCNV